MPCSKEKAHRTKTEEIQTEIKYSQTDSRAKKNHYVQILERKSIYYNKYNSTR